jgi:hypothetical protein
MCRSKLHKDIISNFNYNWYGIGLYDYQEREQNKIFAILDENLLIIDSTNYVRMCPHCNKQYRIYVYGEWPNVRASFDGITDLPICSILPGVKTLKITKLFDEPSFGKFIHASSTNQDIEKHAIIYYPTGDIEYTKVRNYLGININCKPAVCCRTIDNKCKIINSDGEMPNVDIVYATDNNSATFKIGNGILQFSFGGVLGGYIQPIRP